MIICALYEDQFKYKVYNIILQENIYQFYSMHDACWDNMS